MSDAPWFDEAEKFVGLKEIHGSKHEAKILKFFADSGHPEITDDETAWCAAFVGAMLARTGYKNTGSLAARSYEKFGARLNEPKPGCIVVMKRGNSSWQGHVTFFVRKTKTGKIVCRGGNQNDAVTEAQFSPDTVIAYRWPTEKVKSITTSKIAQGATVTATAETADAGLQINDAIEKATQAKDAAQGLGLTDVISHLAMNPRFWIAVAIIAVSVGVIYWRWRDHGRST